MEYKNLHTFISKIENKIQNINSNLPTTMEKDLCELESITFGIFSADEIRNMAVCEVSTSKLSNLDKNNLSGTVYDPRMGTIENGVLCSTCRLGVWECPGHWGFINLEEPLIHPLFYRHVVSFLKCFCIKCYSLLVIEDQINLWGYNKLKSLKRFEKILEKLEKIDICHECGQIQPTIKYTPLDNSISMVYKQKDKNKISIVLPVDEIKKIFENVKKTDVELLGFDTKLMHPSNLILTVFPVIPTNCRPYLISDGTTCDDDLTVQLVEIVKANNNLKPVNGVPVPEAKRQKYSQSLKFRISTFYNNSCLAPDTPVLMWDGGIKRADEIKVGDELVGDDGTVRIVDTVCSGEDEMYEITQGELKYIVNQEHYLTLMVKDEEPYIGDVKVKEVMLYYGEFMESCRGIRVGNYKGEAMRVFEDISIKHIGKGKYNGFMIDGNHRFVLGNGIVTHNSGRAKHTNHRPIKGIKERLTSKNGLIRMNLMGYRIAQVTPKALLV